MLGGKNRNHPNYGWPVPRVEVCIRHCQRDLRDGIFLFRVHEWYQFASSKVKRSGEFWLANTQEWWAEECGFGSTKSVQRAIKSLQAKGLLLSEIHLFGAVPVTWVRPVNLFPHLDPFDFHMTKEYRRNLKDKVSSSKQDSMSSLELDSVSGLEVDDVSSSLVKVKPKAKPKDNQNLIFSGEKMELSSKEGQENSGKTQEGVKLPAIDVEDEAMKAKDVLAGIEEDKVSLNELRKNATDCISHKQLEMLWKKTWAATRDDYCVWASTDANRLSGLKKSLPPEINPGELLFFALEYWLGFVERVKKDKQLPVGPKPMMSKVVQHRDILIDLMGEHEPAGNEPGEFGVSW